MTIREMTINDYETIIRLFENTPGITVREGDSREGIQRYLARNPGLSFVAEDEGRSILGCVMCGHDGRRGYLQHLIVRPEYRKQGLGEALFRACVDALQAIGIYKSHLFVFKDNAVGNSFWASKGWQLRDDLNMYSYNTSDRENRE